MEYSWAEPYPDLQKVCRMFEMTELNNPVKYSYQSLPAYLQEGPQCGLVALAMLMKNCTKQTIESLYELAKNLNFTLNGEIFSVSHMTELTKTCLKSARKVETFQGSLHDDRIKSFLLDGNLMLVPYDSDKDFSPCKMKGHKAHWAVICGAMEGLQDFYVFARHGKARNVAVWKLKALAKSNMQLLEFSPDRKLENVEYKLPEGGIAGPLGLNGQSVLITM